MKLIFRSIEQEQALAILNWCYPTPSDRYKVTISSLWHRLQIPAAVATAVTMIISPSLGSEGDKSFR